MPFSRPLNSSFSIPIALVSIFLILIGWTLAGAALPIVASLLWEVAWQGYPYNMNTSTEMGPSPSTARSDRPFNPSPTDVVVARTMLEKAKSIPPELSIIIMELAEYWPCSRTMRNYPPTSPHMTSGQAVRSNNPDKGNTFLIRAPPVGLQRPPCDKYTNRTYMPPSEIAEEATSDDFKKYLKSSMPLLAHPVRKIVFTIQSEDQGWTHQEHDTYKQSWTWFEAGLERYDRGDECKSEERGGAQDNYSHHSCRETGLFFPCYKVKPVHPRIETDEQGGKTLHHGIAPDSKYTIQRNMVAAKKPMVHTVTWSWLDDIDPQSTQAEDLEDIGRGRESGTGEFVRSLKVGDVVNVWAMARFPGWTNYVHRVSIELYWAV